MKFSLQTIGTREPAETANYEIFKHDVSTDKAFALLSRLVCPQDIIYLETNNSSVDFWKEEESLWVEIYSGEFGPHPEWTSLRPGLSSRCLTVTRALVTAYPSQTVNGMLIRLFSDNVPAIKSVRGAIATRSQPSHHLRYLCWTRSLSLPVLTLFLDDHVK